jgi:hypothetical protein
MERELTPMQREYFQKLREEEEKELLANVDLIQSFKLFCDKSGIALSKEHFKYYQRIGIVVSYPNILQIICPNITRDKEGLLDFNSLCHHFEKRPFSNGYLFGENFVLMAHPYFRRGLHGTNNFAPRFIDFFWNYNKPDVQRFISLDYDRIRIDVDGRGIIELDSWYGAKFNNEVSQINDGVVKLRPPTDLDSITASYFFGDVYSLDIKWETKNGIKSFQAEEFKSAEIKITKDGEEFFPVRYVHAEFDLEQNKFRHFDGAIHFYSSDEYFLRRDSDFNYNSKNSFKIKTASEKLFKMNGSIDTGTFTDFTSHFMTGNPLAIEYFEGKYPDRLIEYLDALRNDVSKNN